MFYLNTLTNSFVLGEKKANGTIIKQLGFPKGGLTYLIENNNVKFYLKEDYFYKNLVFSADAPLLIDGVLVPINNIPAALTKIFHQEAEGSVVDTEFNTESFNAIANSPVSIKFNEIEGVQDAISGKVDTLSGAMETKADRSEIPDVSNFIEMSDVEAYTYDKQTIDTKIENVEVDAYTKQESDARFQPIGDYLTKASGDTIYQPIGDYLTKASGDTIYQPIGDYATRSEIPSVVGYADSVKYNSTTKYVEFYHGGTGGTKVFEYDAAPFLIDGMVQNVEIINGNLVISFNTDAGKQDITIPLTDIFDPSNYYDKTAIDGLLSTKANTATTYNKTEVDTALANKADTSAVTEAISSAVSGKVNTSTYNAYTAATDSRIAEDEEVTAAALNALDDALAEQADDLSAHSANTTIHVTSTEKATWNNKSDFSGDYNDLTNKPTIPTVPTNVSDFTNDAGYITSGDAASQIEEAVSGKVNTSTYNTYTAATDSRLAEDEEVTAAGLNALNDALGDKADTSAVTASIAAAVSGKQDTLIAGSGITISGNVISSEGGGSITVDSAFSRTSENPVQNKVISNNATNGDGDVTNTGGRYKWVFSSVGGLYTNKGFYLDTINGETVVKKSSNTRKLNLVETSAITSAITSASTNAEVAGAKAVYDQLGGLKLVKLTQAEYDALVTKDNSTLYVIVD